MSITDELREYAEDWGWLDMPSKEAQERIEAIADRIDAEHEKAIASVMNDALYYANDRNMAELGWIRLPKDADGEYIRIRDVMDSKVDYLFDGRPFDVRALMLLEDGWEVADGRFGNRYEPNSLRHHHAPTVEDLLRKFAYGLGVPVADSYVAATAAKLRLADDGREQ